MMNKEKKRQNDLEKGLFSPGIYDGFGGIINTPSNHRPVVRLVDNRQMLNEKTDQQDVRLLSKL